MDLSPRSMAAVWMVGLEDEPERCAEICIFEVFGDALGADGGGRPRPWGWACTRSATRRSPRSGPPSAWPIDVTQFHVYAADGGPGRQFLVDGEPVKTVRQAPDYPMQMMSPCSTSRTKAASAPAGHVPELAVDCAPRVLTGEHRAPLAVFVGVDLATGIAGVEHVERALAIDPGRAAGPARPWSAAGTRCCR